MIDEKFIILGAFLNVIGSASYIWSTLKGRTSPNRVTWLLWTVAPLVAFSAEIRHGVGLPALMTFMVGFGPLLIFLASFVNRKSRWKLTRMDIVCGAFSVLGLVLWQLTGSGSLAILCSIVADGLAAVPTIVKAYKAPESEDWPAFGCYALSAMVTLLALDAWDLAHVGFPLYIFGLYVLLVWLVRFRLSLRRAPLVAIQDEL